MSNSETSTTPEENVTTVSSKSGSEETWVDKTLTRISAGEIPHNINCKGIERLILLGSILQSKKAMDGLRRHYKSLQKEAAEILATAKKITNHQTTFSDDWLGRLFFSGNELCKSIGSIATKMDINNIDKQMIGNIEATGNNLLYTSENFVSNIISPPISVLENELIKKINKEIIL